MIFVLNFVELDSLNEFVLIILFLDVQFVEEFDNNNVYVVFISSLKDWFRDY